MKSQNYCLQTLENGKRIEEKKGEVIYSLDRIGIPLVEISTLPDIKTPKQARNVAAKIGMLLRSTGKVKRGIGTIRQDINISINSGARVELKGVQNLDDNGSASKEKICLQYYAIQLQYNANFNND